MIEHENIEKRRELLRGYLLDTLPHSDCPRVEAYVATPEGQRELERERKCLELLDSAQSIQPPVGLARRTAARVREVANNRPGSWRKHSLQWVAAIAGIVVVVAVLSPAFSRAHEAARRSSCQNNLKQLGVIFKMYSGEAPNGLYPPLAPYDGIWMVDIRAIYPEYLTDLNVLIDPSHPNAESLRKQMDAAARENPVDYETITRAAAQSYTYLGWMLLSDADIADAKRALEAGGQDVRANDIIVDRTLHRLSDDVTRFLTTDIGPGASNRVESSGIPVMFDTVTPEIHNHVPGGANVLYHDGHVDFVKRGARFPVLSATQKLLAPQSSAE